MKMRPLKTSLTLIALWCVVLSTQSCTKEDPCEGVSCANGGQLTETESSCECNCAGTLYIGSDCTTPDPNQVQALLDSGVTPLELLTNGVPKERFYGKRYEGGLIFHISDDGTGMVAAFTNQSSAMGWGCMDNDVNGLMNVEICSGMGNCQQPLPEDTFVGARIGDGPSNTNTILDMTNGCEEDAFATKSCRALGADWFLPSRGEINLMYTNLHQNGHGGFTTGLYWSSTEAGSGYSWFEDFANGDQWVEVKNSNQHVRAARTF